MTETILLEMARQVPQSKRQELYDFAYFLVTKYASEQDEERISGFESENEMLDFINDVGKSVYAD